MLHFHQFYNLVKNIYLFYFIFLVSVSLQISVMK